MIEDIKPGNIKTEIIIQESGIYSEIIIWDNDIKELHIKNMAESSSRIKSGIHFLIYNRNWNKMFICVSDKSPISDNDIQALVDCEKITVDFNSQFVIKELVDIVFEDGSNTPMSIGANEYYVTDNFLRKMDKIDFGSINDMDCVIYYGSKKIAEKKLIIK